MEDTLDSDFFPSLGKRLIEDYYVMIFPTDYYKFEKMSVTVARRNYKMKNCRVGKWQFNRD